MITTNRLNITTRVATDANVLINFIHLHQLELLDRLETHGFIVPQRVIEEVTWDVQAEALSVAFQKGHLHPCDLDDDETEDLYNGLCALVEPGEAACIAIAYVRGHAIATDEKGDAERIATELVGKARLLRTESILSRCIHAGLITVAEADAFKATLATKRYAMKFASFADLEAA
ncbi:hypothetical protein [Roseateles sp.]|uniref:hypothetical protein n=1 Tax=Roseateles sp. TaxID=1971397 RepID=UPI002F3F1951